MMVDGRLITDEQIDQAAAAAAGSLRRLGAVGLRTRERTGPDGKSYEVKCRVQRGRAHREYVSGWQPNIVAAAFALITAIEGDVPGRRPKPPAPGVEPMLALPDVVGVAQQVSRDLAEAAMTPDEISHRRANGLGSLDVSLDDSDS